MLELYVMGALTPAEAAEVESIAAQYPEVRAEITEIQEVVEHLAIAAAVSPRPELKGRMLGRIDEADGGEATTGSIRNPVAAASAAPSPVVSESPAQRTAVIPLYPDARVEPRRSGASRYMLAASLVLALLSASAAGYFGMQWKETEGKLTAAVAERERIAHDYEQLKNRVNTVMADMRNLENPDNVVVKLGGQEPAPDARAVVYWDPTSKDVMFAAQALPEPPAGKQYQLWALYQGKPIDAGMIDPAGSPSGLHRMKRIEAADAFAVTLEPAGGVPSPTGAIYVLGKLEV